MKKLSNPVVAIVGATGAVGVEFLGCLEKRKFPLKELKLLASARSAGKTLEFRGKQLTVEELKDDSFAGVDIALFSAGSSISKRFGPLAVRLNVDETFMLPPSGLLSEYRPADTQYGHVAVLAGYDGEGFLVRNSWGTEWGNAGYAYATDAYAAAAFDECYGVLV